MARCQVRDEIEIGAPPARVYAIAADPALVPLYAPEVARIETVETRGDGRVRVRSHLRLLGLTVPFPYLYRYRPPVHYGGIQERGRLLTGYFHFSFRPRGEGTLVTNVEGIASPVPGLARIAAFVYFRVLARGGIRRELLRLKRMAEENHRAAERPAAVRPA